MNYKYVISFLATRQQKDWVSSAPEWIFVSKKSDDGGFAWTEEFVSAAEANGEKFGEPYSSPSVFKSTFYANKDMRCYGDIIVCSSNMHAVGGFFPDENFETPGVLYHYDKKRGILLFSMSGNRVKNVDEFLKKASEIEWQDKKTVNIK